MLEIFSKILKYKTIIISVLAIGVIVFGTVKIKDFITEKHIAELSSEITKKDAAIKELTKQKAEKDKIAADLLVQYEAAKKLAAAANHNTSNLPPLPQISITNLSSDCQKAINEIIQNRDERETIFQNTISVLNTTLEVADNTINALKDEVKTDNTLIAEYASQRKLLDDNIKEINKQLESETSRKKIYRTISLAEAAVILGLLL